MARVNRMVTLAIDYDEHHLIKTVDIKYSAHDAFQLQRNYHHIDNSTF